MKEKFEFINDLELRQTRTDLIAYVFPHYFVLIYPMYLALELQEHMCACKSIEYTTLRKGANI